ncbi:hypothetical protein ANO11243_070790 [Dothideomycetidae sp. 11243]|nr:hypothetical protein ANO11243_070790 [fungal sp. No.11243]
MSDSATIVVLFIVTLVLFFTDDAPSQSLTHELKVGDVIAEEHAALRVLNSSHFLDFAPVQDKWLNLSGLTNVSEFGWSYLDEFRARSENLTEYALGDRFRSKIVGQPAGYPLPLYSNTSGVLHGRWIRNEWPPALPVPALNLTLYAPEGTSSEAAVSGFARNLTGTEGKLRSRQTFDGQVNAVARFVTAQIEADTTDGRHGSWDVQAHGVHFLEAGQLVLSTTSKKFAGFYALPHFTWSPYAFRIAQRLVSHAVQATIDRQNNGSLRTLRPFTSYPEGSVESASEAPHCELIIFLQQHLVALDDTLNDFQKDTALHAHEAELRFPTGTNRLSPEPMRFSLQAFSPDCGYVFESKGPPAVARSEADHLSGIKIETEQRRGRHHILFYINILAAQLWLLTRQMKEASTPSVRSRISFYTICMLAFGDGFATLAFALISLFVPDLWVLLIAGFFFAFLSVSFFGMRFLMDIWTVQAPGVGRRERERRTIPTPTANVATSTIQVPTRMLDAGSMPIMILSSDQDTNLQPDTEQLLPTTALPTVTTPNTPERRIDFPSFYTRFCFTLIATLMITLNAATWPSTFQRVYYTLLALIYLSFWVPQIYHNAYRNCRRALRWDFIIGQSLLRLSPFAYFYGYQWNVLFAEVDFIDLGVLAAWLWVQCLALASQEILGPRWFVKSKWVPPAYDYHPVLWTDEESGNLPVGADAASPIKVSNSSSMPRSDLDQDDGIRGFDCAVCMQTVEAHVHTSASGGEGGLAGAAGLLARRTYMLTPCRHIFHTKCLEGWMKYRLQCPICREDLPPM